MSTMFRILGRNMSLSGGIDTKSAHGDVRRGLLPARSIIQRLDHIFLAKLPVPVLVEKQECFDDGVKSRFELRGTHL